MEWCVGVTVAVRPSKCPNLTRKCRYKLEDGFYFLNVHVCPPGWRRDKPTQVQV